MAAKLVSALFDFELGGADGVKAHVHFMAGKVHVHLPLGRRTYDTGREYWPCVSHCQRLIERALHDEREEIHEAAARKAKRLAAAERAKKKW